MKRYLLLLLISITTSTLFAQTNFRFADSTAQWNVLSTSTGGTTPPGQTSTTVYSIEGDTIIRGIHYQNIDNVFLRRDSINRIYEISYIDTNDFLLYDFSKQAGDTIIASRQEPCVVDSVDSVFLVHLRKRMFVNYYSIAFLDVWIDEIGSLRSFHKPKLTIPHIPEDPSIQLLCFFEKNQLLYHNPVYDTCVVNSIVGIAELQKDEIQIFPNPTTNLITIQSETNFPPQTIFQLFDITGRMVLQKQLTDKTTQVELDEVSKGIYLYNITALENKMGSGKLVVQ